MASLRLTLTTTMRVVDRVHDGTANLRALAEPAASTCLTDDAVAVVLIADLTDSRTASVVDLTHLAAGQTQKDVVAFLRHDLSIATGGAAELAAAADVHLNVMDPRTGRDRVQLQGVARHDVAVVRGDDGRADLQPLRGQDVALLTIRVVNQGDPSGAVRIVLDRRHLTGNADLVALEVDDAVAALVATPAAAHRDAAAVIAPSLLGALVQLALLGTAPSHLGEIRAAHEPPGRRCWVVLTNCHDLPLYCS